jgi:hypothetical protein
MRAIQRQRRGLNRALIRFTGPLQGQGSSQVSAICHCRMVSVLTDTRLRSKRCRGTGVAVALEVHSGAPQAVRAGDSSDPLLERSAGGQVME